MWPGLGLRGVLGAQRAVFTLLVGLAGSLLSEEGCRRVLPEPQLWRAGCLGSSAQAGSSPTGVPGHVSLSGSLPCQSLVGPWGQWCLVMVQRSP